MLCYFFDENFFKIPNRGRVGGLAVDDGWQPSTCENVNTTKIYVIYSAENLI